MTVGVLQLDFTNISNVSPRVNQNENKKLCTFQRTFEIENISTNENISVNENIVIMLLKKKYIVENYMHLTLCANLDSYFIVYKLCH